MTLSFPVSFKIIAGNEAQSHDHDLRQNADEGKETQVGVLVNTAPLSILNQPVPTHSPSWTKNCPRELSPSS